MVLLLTCVPPPTDDEDLYIQQAVVFIEDAVKVRRMTSALVLSWLMNIQGTKKKASTKESYPEFFFIIISSSINLLIS